MRCAHCSVEFHTEFNKTYLRPTRNDKIQADVYYTACPNCKNFIMYFKLEDRNSNPATNYFVHINPEENGFTIGFPKNKKNTILSSYIPDDYRKDFEEAESVLDLSPKASAALSRRLLQKLLENHVKIAKGDLINQIQEVIDSKKLPSHLEEQIDAIRNIGNFAAHASKSKSTGTIVDVEPSEADWNLELLNGLFDFYFVLPEKAKARKAALNTKLSSFNKPPLK